MLCLLLASCGEQAKPAESSAPEAESSEEISVSHSSLPQESASESDHSVPEESDHSVPEESAPEEFQPSATYSDMEVLRTFEDGLMVL
jgi:hypothetical protein